MIRTLPMVPSAAGGVFELAQTQQVTMEDMLAQLQASKNLLDALRALPRFPDISRSECARLQGCLALHALTPAQLACAAQGVKQAGFLQKDEDWAAPRTSPQLLAAMPRDPIV